MFVSLEGIDGCGKSNISVAVAKRLAKAGYRVLKISSGGGTSFDKCVRDSLNGKSAEMSPVTHALAVSVARRQALEETVIPALSEGRIVITDRCHWSTNAYQGAQGVPYDFLESLDEMSSVIKPARVYFIEVSPETCLERRASRPREDAIEKKGLRFQKEVRSRYFNIMRNASEKEYLVVDGEAPFDNVVDVISTDILSRLNSADEPRPDQSLSDEEPVCIK